MMKNMSQNVSSAAVVIGAFCYYSLTDINNDAMSVSILTVKAPITTAADDKFCEIFHNFRKK